MNDKVTRAQRWIVQEGSRGGWMINLRGDGKVQLGDADTATMITLQIDDDDNGKITGRVLGSSSYVLVLQNDREVELAISNRGASVLELEILNVLARSSHVNEWPADEAAAYRDAGGFELGQRAVALIRARKIIELVEKKDN